ncbi:MAG: hypothetical protein K940chlam1_00485 [Candidatus Anoxychlamydiales bacterium]|nr:hypothetical protein [Candidatus Anoxychlamydiales bacterium]
MISIIVGTLSVLEIQETSGYSKAFFLIYSYAQSILEICAFAFLAWVIQKNLPKIFFNIFIGLIFVFLVSHIIDLAVFKMLDLTFWDGLGIALDEDLENFIEMLHTTGIPFFAWIIFGILILLLPLAGIGFYKLTNKLAKKRKLFLAKDHLIQLFLCIPLAICFWDYKASGSILPNVYNAYTRSLPWKLTFIQPKTLTTSIQVALKSPKNEKETLLLINQKNLSTNKKPNIFIFVIESLRNDYITDDIAPNLSSFKKSNISFDRSLSNANATHQSWFSFFYSNYPYHWKNYKDLNWKSGAISLQILKKMGYKINVFSAPELKYYKMKDLLFGEDQYLCENFKLFPHYYPKEACDSDKEVFSAMRATLEEDQNVYIAFLDSTHFLYSWPKDFDIKFRPIAEIESFKSYASKDTIDLIKNRYKNSIYFVDSLIQSFFDTLKKKNLFDDSIIIITGDHGEEFYEEGRLFHASHLSSAQTNVPIYLKLGKNQRNIPKRDLISHIDVMPSIFDYIFEKNQFSDLLNGESIFEKPILPFTVTTRYNGSRTPVEFFIHTKEDKLTFRFKNTKELFKKQPLEIISLKDVNSNPIDIASHPERIKYFEEALENLFNK